MDAPETTIYNAVLITSGALGCIIVYFALSVFYHKRRYVEMQRKYFFNEVEVLERERQRIAQDLHDELGPVLSVARMQVETIETLNEKGEGLKTKVSRNVNSVIERLGGIAANLSPKVLARRGLKTAVEAFVDSLEGPRVPRIRFQYAVYSSLSMDFSLQIYRIVQELLHNAVKHSDATNVEISIRESDRGIQLYYKDNGKGFDYAAQVGKGMGLMSLKGRTIMAGGQFHLVSKPGLGTTYFFDLPKKMKG
jgi:two-component system, NarL family, sensor kinase